jgi:hypothetical protein
MGQGLNQGQGGVHGIQQNNLPNNNNNNVLGNLIQGGAGGLVSVIYISIINHIKYIIIKIHIRFVGIKPRYIQN